MESRSRRGGNEDCGRPGDDAFIPSRAMPQTPRRPNPLRPASTRPPLHPPPPHRPLVCISFVGRHLGAVGRVLEHPCRLARDAQAWIRFGSGGGLAWPKLPPNDLARRNKTSSKCRACITSRKERDGALAKSFACAKDDCWGIVTHIGPCKTWRRGASLWPISARNRSLIFFGGVDRKFPLGFLD